MNEIRSWMMSEEELEHNRENDWPDLTDQQKVFCYHYVTSYDVVKAGREIGVGPAKARSILGIPLVKAFIAELKDMQRVRLEIDQDMVTALWLRTLPALFGDEGMPRIVNGSQMEDARHFDAGALISALKELGNIAGMTKKDDGMDGDSPSLNITIGVAEAKGEVKLTNAKNLDSDEDTEE